MLGLFTRRSARKPVNNRVRLGGDAFGMVERLEDREVPAVVTWLGTASTSWGTGNNWDTGNAPTALDTVVVPQNSPVLVVNVAAACQSLTFGTPTTTWTPTVNVNNNLTVGNGGISGTGVLFNVGSTLSSSGTIAANGCTFAGSGTFKVASGGTWTMTDTTATFRAVGLTVESGGTLTMNNSTITSPATGPMNMYVYGSLYSHTGTNTLDNVNGNLITYGTVQVSASPTNQTYQMKVFAAAAGFMWGSVLTVLDGSTFAADRGNVISSPDLMGTGATVTVAANAMLKAEHAMGWMNSTVSLPGAGTHFITAPTVTFSSSQLNFTSALGDINGVNGDWNLFTTQFNGVVDETAGRVSNLTVRTLNYMGLSCTLATMNPIAPVANTWWTWMNATNGATGNMLSFTIDNNLQHREIAVNNGKVFQIGWN